MLQPTHLGNRYYYPLLRHPLSRVLKLEKYQEYLRQMPRGGVVLDFGSGDQPYEAMLLNFFDRYISADDPATNMNFRKRPDLPVVDGRVDVPDGFVDCIVCTEVLQHLYEPRAVLGEFFRMLRPGGYLIGSVPFARGELDLPHDYFRYTSFALRRMFREAGFSVHSVEYVGDLVAVTTSSIAGILDVLPRLLCRLRLNALAWPLRLVFRVPEFVYYAVLKAGVDPGRLAMFSRFPLGYTFRAQKPLGSSPPAEATPAPREDDPAVSSGRWPALAVETPLWRTLVGKVLTQQSPIRSWYRARRRHVLNTMSAHFGPSPAPEKWVFIVGCYNSGTTLLHDILATHREIGSMFDEGQFNQTELLRPIDVGLDRGWALQPDLFSMHEFDPRPVNVERIKRQWGARFNDPHRSVLIEKTPVNAARVRWLQQNFENAYFIGIIRNGYAVAEGIHRKAGRSLAESARQWRESNAIMLENLAVVPRAKIIRYENLTNATDATIRDVLAFVGLDATGIVTAGRKWQIHEQFAPIGDMNHRSLKSLTPAEKLTIEAEAGDMLRQLGYLT